MQIQVHVLRMEIMILFYSLTKQRLMQAVAKPAREMSRLTTLSGRPDNVELVANQLPCSRRFNPCSGIICTDN